MLEGVEVSVTKEQRTNEDSSVIYGLSDDVLKHCFGYDGSKQYGFVAGTSDKFRKVYLETFEKETLTSIDKATASIACAEMCLAETETRFSYNRSRKLFFSSAAKNGQLATEMGTRLWLRAE